MLCIWSVCVIHTQQQCKFICGLQCLVDVDTLFWLVAICMGRIGHRHIWPLRKTHSSALCDVACKPTGEKEKKDPMGVLLSLTRAFVSTPCYHVKLFFFSQNSIKGTLAHYRGCNFWEHILKWCVSVTFILLLCWNAFLQPACPALWITLYHFLGHMRPLLVFLEDLKPVIQWSYPEDVTEMIAAPEIPSDFPFPQ